SDLLFVFVLFLSCAALHAQKNINGLIGAEKSFAAYSVSHSIKEAFLKYADAKGIIFEKAVPVNAVATWSKREKRPGLLNWHPRFAEISESGEFGYTTGPYSFQLSSDDTIKNRGEYVTVWHINEQGEWKCLIHLGIINTQVA